SFRILRDPPLLGPRLERSCEPVNDEPGRLFLPLTFGIVESNADGEGDLRRFFLLPLSV
uniref:Cytochrome P450 n=1 Tax=Schistosoma curassoni TaxID=6186 RepID=A0A183K8Q1_9TREM